MIPTSPFNDSSAIYAQQDQMRLKKQILDYGVNVATQCKTSLSDFQIRLNQAIAANSLGAAVKIMDVGKQTVAQALSINDGVFHFVNHSIESPAGKAHNAADANLAAAKQTLAQMQSALGAEAKKRLKVATDVQTSQDDKLMADMASLCAAAKAWNNKVTGSLGELSACFAGAAPPTGVNCNVFVGRALKTLYNVSDFNAADGHYLSANETADFLMTSPKWIRIGSGDSQSVLNQAANSAGSRPVVAVWRNPDPNDHGHVALIGPGPLLPSGWWVLNSTSNPVILYVPNSAGFSIDDKNVIARYIGGNLSRAFGNDKKSEVQIYVRLNP